MSERKFNVGDRVRVVRTNNPELASLVGIETTITGVVEHDSVYAGQFVLDVPPPEGKVRVCAVAEHLQHIYDGHEKTSWSECAWQPKGVRA